MVIFAVNAQWTAIDLIDANMAPRTLGYGMQRRWRTNHLMVTFAVNAQWMATHPIDATLVSFRL